MAQLNFDASQVDPQFRVTLIPAGTYVGQIVDSMVRAARSGNGKYLELRMVLADGDTMRRYTVRLNLWHANPVACEIARAELSAICRAVGVLRPTDSAELHGRPMAVTIGVRRRKDRDEDENYVVDYRALPPAQTAKSDHVPPAAEIDPAVRARVAENINYAVRSNDHDAK